MTPDAALDNLAFLVGLRLMGVDARRRLRLALLRHPDLDTRNRADGIAERLEGLDAMLDGRREPETLQDRLDLARAEHERAAAPFDPAFWLARSVELMGAGFTAQQAALLVQEVRGRVDADTAGAPQFEEETA
ncbi:hypothetical protein [Sphingomonas sp.]|uniref:hypothetical protein n=1 Tax=Sphingomonas sp. TaxID=28214 RepID=UPI002DD678D3|nr:hypothetical protein [Sphingomonas sp.]